MTEQDYSNDLVFRSNGEEYARIDGNKAWKPLAPTGNLLVGKFDVPPPSISFNTRDAGEIAKFTEEGFYYKGEFVDDAGEVHRLLKDVLNGICYKQLCKDLVDELEDWIAFSDEEDIVDAHALVDRARAALNA